MDKSKHLDSAQQHHRYFASCSGCVDWVEAENSTHRLGTVGALGQLETAL